MEQGIRGNALNCTKPVELRCNPSEQVSGKAVGTSAD